jgi:hypothetical protein
MMNLALWLKRNGLRADQVQTFYPSPMASATAMYHSGLNPLKGISRDPAKAETVDIVRGEKRRRLHKAFLRYHDAAHWPLLREALAAMGRADLIGNGKQHLVPTYQPAGTGMSNLAHSVGPVSKRAIVPAAPRRGAVLTQHSGLPPRAGAPVAHAAAGARPGIGRKKR